jgi:hypothetical protein
VSIEKQKVFRASALRSATGCIRSEEDRAFYQERRDELKTELDAIDAELRDYVGRRLRVYASRTRFIPEDLLGLFDRTSWPPVAVGAPARVASQGVRINVSARMRGMWR